MNILKKFKSKKPKTISFEELKSFPENETINLRNDNIQLTRLSNDSEDLSFRIVMKKEEYWETHLHDCKETIILYKGSIADKETEVVMKKLQTIEIEPFVKHRIEALEDSIFYVEFKKPLE